MRILLLTFAQLATNPRLVKEADALSAAGHHVEVITGDYNIPWRDAANDAYRGRPWKIVERVAYGSMASLPQRLRQTVGHRLSRNLWHAGFKKQYLELRAWHPVTSNLIRAASRHPADLFITHYPAPFRQQPWQHSDTAVSMPLMRKTSISVIPQRIRTIKINVH